jgi:1-acyl-sn-glycerol-3-phosphate acyltransferase
MLSLATPTKQSHRKLPLLSEIVYFPVTLLYATLHFLLHPWPRLEGIVGTAFMGGYFGLFFIPTLLMWQITRMVEWSTGVSSSFILFSTIVPFALVYSVQIMWFDQTHCAVENSGAIPPRNFLEQAAIEFMESTWQCNEVECIPWTVSVAGNSTTPKTSEPPATLDPSRQYIFGVHPHGIHCMPLTQCQFNNENSAFRRCFPGLSGPKLTGVAATVLFKIPVVREGFLLMGYIDASRKVCSDALSKGQSLFICTGGEEESMLTQKGQDLVVLKKRKGFIRLALRYGADLVPVFGAGNNDTYDTYSFGLRWRSWFQKKTGIALPIFHGRWFTPLPYPVPIKILVGKPIQTPTPKSPGAMPDEELVEEYHSRYINELKQLHGMHVHDRTLIIR